MTELSTLRSRSQYAPLALLLLAPVLRAQGPAPAASAPTAQAATPDDELQKKIDTFLGHARRGSAVIRPQAADRLVGIGEPAARRILEVAGKTSEQLALLGPNLVEIFGAFEDSESGD